MKRAEVFDYFVFRQDWIALAADLNDVLWNGRLVHGHFQSLQGGADNANGPPGTGIPWMNELTGNLRGKFSEFFLKFMKVRANVYRNQK